MEMNIYAAKTHLSRLVDQVNAGEEIVITRHGRPVGRPVPAEAAKPRKLRLLEGKGYWVADDFDAPLPDDLLDLFEGKASGAEEQGCTGPHRRAKPGTTDRR
jgi:prevent-host-death family protein